MELEVKGSTVLSSTAHHKLRWNLDHLEVPEMETMCETKIDVERNHDHISELLSPDFRRSGCLKQSVLSSEASTPQSGSEDAVDLREVFGSLSTPLPLMKSSMSRKRTMKRSRRSDELETFIAMKNVSAASDLMAIHENIVSSEFLPYSTEGGSLAKRLQILSRFSESDAASICLYIVEFLLEAHSKGIMHRNLNPESIFLRSNHSNKDISIGGFENATFFYPGARFSEPVGPARYMSPEMADGSYGSESDLWNLGAILYLILTGKEPLSGNSEEEIQQSLEKFTRIDIKSTVLRHVSSEAKDLISGLLERDEKRRLTAEEVQCHPWILLYRRQY